MEKSIVSNRRRSIDNDTCPVCLEKLGYMSHINFVNNKYTSDVSVCQECLEKLQHCPTCRSNIFFMGLRQIVIIIVINSV